MLGSEVDMLTGTDPPPQVNMCPQLLQRIGVGGLVVTAIAENVYETVKTHLTGKTNKFWHII